MAGCRLRHQPQRFYVQREYTVPALLGVVQRGSRPHHARAVDEHVQAPRTGYHLVDQGRRRALFHQVALQCLHAAAGSAGQLLGNGTTVVELARGHEHVGPGLCQPGGRPRTYAAATAGDQRRLTLQIK